MDPKIKYETIITALWLIELIERMPRFFKWWSFGAAAVEKARWTRTNLQLMLLELEDDTHGAIGTVDGEGQS